MNMDGKFVIRWTKTHCVW